MSNQGRWLGDWPGDWWGADGSAPTQAAPRSLLAFWAGGAVAGVAPATTVGVRSLLAPWMGGASAPSGTDPAATAAPRGLLGFWAGGYSVGAEIPPEPDIDAQLLGGPDRIHDPRRRIEFTDDDLFRIAAAIILTGALDG